MKTMIRLTLPLTAVGTAVLLLSPAEETNAYTTIGGSLSTLQRDVRVYDNFLDATANDNTSEDPQFPGYTGVELAMWKGIVEWGSLPHGDGSGDPLQPNLGDGGANFDASWQGNAVGIGGPNDNIVSAQTSCGGTGVLAYTETPISTGWRIRFCDEWAWHDGPGTVPVGNNNFDLQEIQTHEYGHALGLGHSTDALATMRPSTPPGSEAQRSINADDIAGVQFIYGAASSTKPVITSISGRDMATILGSNFTAAGNEVWFTQSAAGGTGNPVKVTGVTSVVGGTVIIVTVPAAAGPGDVLVKNGNSGHASLSNAMPFDNRVPPPETYCSGKPNSNFCFPFITYTGLPSVTSTAAFLIQGNDVMPDEFGILIYGLNGRSALNFHNGTLCVKAPFVRVLPPKNSGSAGSGFCPGELRRNFNATIQSGAHPLLSVGQTVNAQWIYRDPGVDSFNDGLTDGIEFIINP